MKLPRKGKTSTSQNVKRIRGKMVVGQRMVSEEGFPAAYQKAYGVVLERNCAFKERRDDESSRRKVFKRL